MVHGDTRDGERREARGERTNNTLKAMRSSCQIEWKPSRDSLIIFRINSKCAKLAVIMGYVREMS